MFEINDERLGRLKIFNVTEARANFADVLKEGTAKVVVTRHGRPTKIMLSYEEYIGLLGAASDKSAPVFLKENEASIDTGSNSSLENQDPEKGTVPPKWVQRDAEQIVSSLKGLFNK